jgi:hypothetical protein
MHASIQVNEQATRTASRLSGGWCWRQGTSKALTARAFPLTIETGTLKEDIPDAVCQLTSPAQPEPWRSGDHMIVMKPAEVLRPNPRLALFREAQVSIRRY